MFVDFLDQPLSKELDFSKFPIRGIMAGAMCPEQLLLDLKREFNLEIFICYGTTENSPVTFMTTKNDTLAQKVYLGTDPKFFAQNSNFYSIGWNILVKLVGC